MVVRRRRNFGSVANKRKLVWARESSVLTTLTGAGVPASVNLLSTLETAMGSNLLGATVRGIRGTMGVWQTAGTALGLVRAGVLVLPSATTAAAVTPVTEPFADWMLWRPVITVPPSFTGSNNGRDTFDFMTKSSRRVEELDQEVRLVFDTAGGGTSPVWAVVYDLSVLIALP